MVVGNRLDVEQPALLAQLIGGSQGKAVGHRLFCKWLECHQVFLKFSDLSGQQVSSQFTRHVGLKMFFAVYWACGPGDV